MYGYYVHTINTGIFNSWWLPYEAIKSSRTLRNTFGNTDGNGFRSPDRGRCPQIEESLVGNIYGTSPRLPMNAYIYKNYTAAPSSSCLFI